MARNAIRLAAVATLAAAASFVASSGAQANITLQVDAGPTATNVVGNCIVVAPGGTLVYPTGTGPSGIIGIPFHAETTCGDSQGVNTGRAAATIGHVGSYTNAFAFGTGSNFSNSSAFASYTDDSFVFTSTDPAVTDVTVSLNVGFGGTLNSAQNGIASVSATATINGTSAGFTQTVIDGVTTACNNTFVSVPCNSVLASAAVVFESASVTVPVNIPITVSLFLQADSAASTPGSATVDFGGSLDFVTGMDLFNLADGVTVNAPDAFVFNNRFVLPGPPSGLPEPTTLAVMGLSLAGLGLIRRKRPA